MSRARYAAWAALLLAHGVAAAWLFAHPAAIPFDDALFFVRSLTRFSVLDFSPQFPGYPGFVAMGRLLLPWSPDPAHALAALTALLALAIPPLTVAAASRAGASGWSLLAAFTLALANPLLPDLALNLMPDGAGIAFLMLFLALLPGGAGDRGHGQRLMPYLAGLALGWALACRPSDLVLCAGAFAGAVVRDRRLAVPLVLGGAVAVLPVAAVVFASEGMLYVAEGARFVTGHAQIWGNTPFSAGGQRSGWLASISAVPGGVVLAILLLAGVLAAIPGARGRGPVLSAAFAAFLAHAVWIAAFQNPDHLRHLAPLTVLGALILGLATDQLKSAGAALSAGALAAELAALAGTLDVSPGRAPPLGQLVEHLAQAPDGSALATNEAVSALRDLLPRFRIYDMRYPADAQLGLASAGGAAFQLTTTPKANVQAQAVFAGRCAGELTLYLYTVP